MRGPVKEADGTSGSTPPCAGGVVAGKLGVAVGFVADDPTPGNLTRRTDLKINVLEVVFLNFEVWVAESKVFDVKFHFSVSKSPWGQVLSRFHWIGDGFSKIIFF